MRDAFWPARRRLRTTLRSKHALKIHYYKKNAPLPIDDQPSTERGACITLRYLWNIFGFAGSSGAQRRKLSVENTVDPRVIKEKSLPRTGMEAALEALAETSCVAHTDKLAGPKLYSTSPPTAKTLNFWALVRVPNG